MIQTFVLPSPNSAPLYITAGPDGNVWFTEANKIGRITSSGQITEFAESASQLVTGSDGNLWYAVGNNQVGRITSSGAITHFGPFTLPMGANLGGATIANGPDGNIWVSGLGILLKISPANGIIAAQYSINGGFITGGDDGNLWATLPTQVERITPSGMVSTFTPPNASAGLYGISVWSDGNIWFTEGPSGIPNQIRVGRVTPNGVVSEFVVPNSQGIFGLTTGSDGNLWIADYFSLYKMTTPGQFVQYAVASAHKLQGIVGGPDGNIWFTDTAGNSIGKLILH